MTGALNTVPKPLPPGFLFPWGESRCEGRNFITLWGCFQRTEGWLFKWAAWVANLLVFCFTGFGIVPRVWFLVVWADLLLRGDTRDFEKATANCPADLCSLFCYIVLFLCVKDKPANFPCQPSPASHSTRPGGMKNEREDWSAVCLQINGYL